MKINERLKNLRKENGFKLREIARETGLSISYISDLEHGRQNPSLETCMKLARFYCISLSTLFSGVTL